MLDRHLRPLIDHTLAGVARLSARAGLKPDALTAAGLGLGLLAALSVVLGWFGTALLLFVASRLMDGLDGAVARLSPAGPLGGYLDIMADFTTYAALPLGFAASDPASNALPAAILLAGFFVNGASFLGFAILAEKRGMESRVNGKKAHYHAAGLIEGTETIIFFVVVCLWPAGFAWLAPLFALLVLVTAVWRVRTAMALFCGQGH